MTNRYVQKRQDGNWENKKQGNDKASSVHKTQLEAEKSAKQMIKNEGGGEVVIKRPNGQIRDKDTIGKSDPYPPKDQKH